MRRGFRGLRVWLWKVVVWTAFGHQTSCCLSGTVGFAHVQRMLSNTGIMVEECFPSWKGEVSVRQRSVLDVVSGGDGMVNSRPRIREGKHFAGMTFRSGN